MRVLFNTLDTISCGYLIALNKWYKNMDGNIDPNNCQLKQHSATKQLPIKGPR